MYWSEERPSRRPALLDGKQQRHKCHKDEPRAMNRWEDTTHKDAREDGKCQVVEDWEGDHWQGELSEHSCQL